MVVGILVPISVGSVMSKASRSSSVLSLADSGAGPEPPRPLGVHGRDLWDRVMHAYGIMDVGGIELLCLACQAIDRAESCRAAIDRDGEMICGRDGVMRRNQLLRDELANRAFAARCVDRLGINQEALKPVGRPPKAVGWSPPDYADE